MAKWYEKYARRNAPDEVISANNDGTPYLQRWHLIPKNKFCNIYLHHFVGPDNRTMHDHPWISLAYMLEGQFYEVYRRTHPVDFFTQTRVISAGQWTYRNSTFLHYLTPEKALPCWTVFITGPKIRNWGFLTETGWKPWRKVVKHFKPSERRDY